MVAPHKVGDWVKVPETCFNSYGYDTKYKTAEVVEVIDDTHIKVRGLDYDYKKPVIVTIDKCHKSILTMLRKSKRRCSQHLLT